MSFFKAILECLTGSKDAFATRRTYGSNTIEGPEDEERLASDILNILFRAEKTGEDMKERLNNIVHPNSWYEGLAKRILDNLVKALNSGAVMGPAMKDAFDKASEVANDFAKKHPVFAAVLLTVVAIGILAILVPWVVEALGFGELGPVAGSWAARWQSTLPNVEARSLFSYLQRLGMKWAKNKEASLSIDLGRLYLIEDSIKSRL